ncbi:hypothetical protein SBOR_4813 [Sclerotinia borealis F-4128]|uniref:Chitin synthase regulatory factor 3 n=1 Tax=Sclerotinia borealis (strain F-4128) TaxID=1432307 RepID=W9CJI0_SCLBF|nr:hypothetical protein SBOR_4813 [Sclerotinia borealis F-4128]
MAYDQGYYEQPQRSYNGWATQRPGAAQGYQQPPAQQYSQQQYEDHGQDGFGYENFDNGYGQDYNGGYQDMNGGGRGNVNGERRGGYAPDMNGRERGYPPNVNGEARGYPSSNQNYPPQQEHYANDRGRMQPRAGGPGAGGPNDRDGLMQRPPDNAVYGEPQGRGYPANDGPVNGNGRPIDGSVRPRPGQGQQRSRKPLVTLPKSPEAGSLSFDSPFPTFPGARKKTAMSEEEEITRKMGAIDISSPPPSKRPGTAGSKGSNDNFGPKRVIPTDNYGRPSMDSQRSASRGGYMPQGPPQGMPDQRRGPPPRGMTQGPPRQDFSERRGPPPVQRYGGAPRQNGYGDHGYDQYGNPMSPGRDDQENFGPPQRSMTMPDNPGPMGIAPPASSMGGPGMSAPYNGPIGRGMPVRPATATGSRLPPQRTYPNQQPVQSPPPQQQYPPQNDYSNGAYADHNPDESLSTFYDAYYEAPPQPPMHNRNLSNTSEMPDFDSAPQQILHRRGTSIEAHIQPGAGSGPGFDNMQADGPLERNGNLRQVKPVKSQPDFRAQAQAQTAIFEMAGDAPPIPSMPQQGYQDGWAQQNAQYNQYQGPPQDQGYDQYPNQAPKFQPPPRSMSAAPGASRGLPNGPKSGFGGLPNSPLPQSGGYPGPQNGGFQGGRQNSLQKQGNPEGGLPPHAPPVRAGLIPNSFAQQQQNIKPPPVRNYGGVNPPPQANTPVQAPNSVSPAGSTLTKVPAQPVTQAEIDRLRLKYKNGNPNDNEAPLLFVKKLVEASDVLVAPLADQRVRNKAREKYVLEATKVLKKLREAQNPDAMFYFADCYGRGALGLEVSEKEAFTLYQSAAKLGHPQAAYRTAVCCELGNEEGGGTRKDPLKAIQWYKRAATLGDTPAMYKMGMIQLKGLLGQPINAREAVVWLKRAAERADPDNPHALHELGLLYEAPQGQDTSLVRDEGYAFQLFQQAADLGYKFSQFRLGQAYEYGQFNCPIDPRSSIAWYSKAAVQEEHQSELALSGWYLTGYENILQQSDMEAYLWAKKAAMAKLAKAEYAMGYYSEEGIGTAKSLEDAKRWYWRAAAQNFPKAREKLEELKRSGGKQSNNNKGREKISRSKGANQKNNEECSVM